MMPNRQPSCAMPMLTQAWQRNRTIHPQRRSDCEKCGLKAAIAKILHATWQRCRVHTMRNLMAYAGKQGRGVAAAFIATAFAQDTAEAAKAQWRKVADQLRPTVPKLAAAM